MIRKDEVRAVRDVQPASDVDPGLSEHFDFFNESDRINHHAHANDRMLFGAQNTARDELENVFVFADDDSMSGVMATGDANDEIEGAGEVVHDFAFSFVTPLCADYNDRFHAMTFRLVPLASGAKAPSDRLPIAGAKAPAC